MTDILPFEDPGDREPVLWHTYAKDGIYNVTAFISNDVSGYEVSCEVGTSTFHKKIFSPHLHQFLI